MRGHTTLLWQVFCETTELGLPLRNKINDLSHKYEVYITKDLIRG